MSDDQEDCMLRIEPILPALYDALQAGMAVFQDPQHYSREAAAQMRGRTAKNCVYDHAFHRLRENLDGQPGHHFLNIRNLEVLNYRDRAVIRIKHVNGSSKGKNFQTAQQRHYDDQRSFLPFLPDEAVRLVAGYQPDAVFSSIDRIIISRPLGRTILWAAQVNRFENVTSWADITPPRLFGTEREDFNANRRRGG